MAALREFLGQKCPVCARDILQAAPSLARMPPGDYAYCPSCESALTVSDLTTLARSKQGFLARLFGKPTRV